MKKLEMVVNNSFYLKNEKKSDLRLVVDNGPISKKRNNKFSKKNLHQDYRHYTQSSIDPITYFIEKNELLLFIVVGFIVGVTLSRSDLMILKVFGFINLISLAVTLPFFMRILYVKNKIVLKKHEAKNSA